MAVARVFKSGNSQATSLIELIPGLNWWEHVMGAFTAS